MIRIHVWTGLAASLIRLQIICLSRNESAIDLRDYIDIGVYGEDEDGEEKLLYIKKHLITSKETQVRIELNQKPLRAGIDPINKLIDRNPDDNVMELEPKEEGEDEPEAISKLEM